MRPAIFATIFFFVIEAVVVWLGGYNFDTRGPLVALVAVKLLLWGVLIFCLVYEALTDDE